MDWRAGSATTLFHDGYDSVSGEAIGVQLRDLLLRFPCAVLDGVRWSALCKAYRERFPDAPNPCGTALCSSAGLAARSWLADIADCKEDTANAGADGWLQLRDGAALTPGSEGQLACWPLLVQRLGEIVRTHGCPQSAQAVGSSSPALVVAEGRRATTVATGGEAEDEAVGEAGGTAGGAAAEGSGTAEKVVLGVLLAQLKPLLRRHWDPAFEERAVGYYNEAGKYISIKKMKHLVAKLLKWRLQRCSSGRASQVDAVLETPELVLATSARHNDMVLCCTIRTPASYIHGRELALTPMAQRSLDSQLPVQPFSAQVGKPHIEAILPELPVAKPTVSPATSSPCRFDRQGFDAHRLDNFEKDSQKLRIENAELKKRVRFGADFLHKEIRRLRIENAELKKRLFFPAYLCAAPLGTSSSPHVQRVWVPLVATAAGPAKGSLAKAAPLGGSCASSAAPVPLSGQVSPAQGSLTPIPHGFCYAVPWAQGVPNPSAHTWSSTVGPVMAVPFGTAAGALFGNHHERGGSGGAAMSPHSDSSHQMRLLPRSLLGSDGASSTSQVSNAASPRCWGQAAPTADVPAMQLQGSDDRWVCIPSGIVERHKAQFEGHEGQCGNGGCHTDVVANALPSETTGVVSVGNKVADKGEKRGAADAGLRDASASLARPRSQSL